MARIFLVLLMCDCQQRKRC